MSELLDILKPLENTPLPTLLAVGGFLFILLALVDKVGVVLELPAGRRKSAAITGSVLLALGIILYALPATFPPVSAAGVTASSAALPGVLPAAAASTTAPAVTAGPAPSPTPVPATPTTMPTQPVSASPTISAIDNNAGQQLGFAFEGPDMPWQPDDKRYANLRLTTSMVYSGKQALEVDLKNWGPGPDQKNAYIEAKANFGDYPPDTLATLAAQNWTGKQITCQAYFPAALASDKNGHHTIAELFVRDNEGSWRNDYGPSIMLSQGLGSVDKWIPLSVKVGSASDSSELNPGFDPASVMEMGVALTTQDGSTLKYTGPFYVDACVVK